MVGALLDAEGPLLRSRASDLIASSGVTAEDFTVPANRQVFEAVRSLADRQRPTDAKSVYSTLKGITGITPEGAEWLASIQADNSCTREALAGHAEELRRLTRLRKLSAFYAAAQAELAEPRPDPVKLSASLETFAQSFCATTDTDETGDRDMYDILEDWDAFAKGIRQPYMATGIEILDSVIQGFVPNLNVIGGMPSMGKSALIGEIIMACLERGERVGLFGLEDATKWLTKRHVARSMNMPVGAVAAVRLHPSQEERLAATADALTGLTRNLLVYRRAGIGAAELVQRCKHWILNLGCKAVFIDHGGEVAHEKVSRDRNDLAVASTYRALRDLAVNSRVPIIVLAHFNRATETDQSGVPSMQSFAETEYIARMARLALGLWTKPDDPRLRLTVLKRTEGERGVTVAIERDENCALVKRTGGGVVDLGAERRKERKAKAAARKAEKNTGTTKEDLWGQQA